MSNFFWPQAGEPDKAGPDEDISNERAMHEMMNAIIKEMGERGPALEALLDKPGDPAPEFVEVMQKVVDARVQWLTEDFSAGGKTVQRLLAAGPAYDQTLKALADYVDAHRV